MRVRAPVFLGSLTRQTGRAHRSFAASYSSPQKLTISRNEMLPFSPNSGHQWNLSFRWTTEALK
jgi:hypothetical protein